MPLYSDLTFIGPANVRSSAAIKYGITFHNTSNKRLASARDEATYAKRRTDAGAHYYVDKNEIVQALNTDLGAGHAGSSWPNRHCIAYEITGWNSFSRERWLSDVAWDKLARQVARDCKRWGIPARWLTVGQLDDHERGFNTHDDCRRAFGGTFHTDPGPNFPKDHLLKLVNQHLGGTSPSPTVPRGLAAPAPPLRQGDEGPRAGQLQAALNAVTGSRLAVDDDFGPATTAALKAFQRAVGIADDGIYGPVTAGKLAQAIDALEDDMPTAKEIAQAVWETDGVIKAPSTALKVDPANTHWAASSFLRSLRDHAVPTLTELRAVKKQNDAILAKLAGADTKTILAEIQKAAVEDAARDTAAADALAEIAALVAKVGSGQLAADAVVDLIAERLSPAGGE